MKKHLFVLIVLLVWVFSTASGTAFAGEKKGMTINGLPLHVKKLSDNAIRLWVGDYISSTAVCALNTKKGIVVIDTTQCPSIDVKFKKIIAKKFGRDDFIYLINTHEHGDHTAGNQLYSDCEIIAHEKCAAGMKRTLADLDRVMNWYKEHLPKLEKQMKEAEGDAEKYAQLKERLIVEKMTLEVFKKGLKPTYPTKTFKDKMKLDLGNMTLELYAMGGLHSASDIFVFVPEEGLLFTGDIMADTWLTDTPGCLQSFGGRTGLERDLPLLLANWKGLIARKDEIKRYVTGHWNGELSTKGFVDRFEYLVTLKKEVKKAAKEGKDLQAVLADLKLETRFPHLAGKPGFTIGFVHNNNVLTMWSEITGATSASTALSTMIEKKGLDAALAKFKKGDTKKYYYLEQDFNQLGYRYMGQDKMAEAIAVFKLNVKMNPESWNVYDSLGEAYLKAEKKDLALKSYEQALKLNTQQTEGAKKQYQHQKKILKKLKTSH